MVLARKISCSLLFGLYFFTFISASSFAASMANVQYVHDIILSRQRIDLPMNSLTNPMAGANMKYLLTAIDRANDLNPCATTPTDYGNSSYATQYAADTIAVDKAVGTLIAPGYFGSSYLTFNGTNLINTGVQFSSDLRFEINYTYTGNCPSAYVVLFGGKAGPVNQNACGLLVSTNLNSYRWNATGTDNKYQTFEYGGCNKLNHTIMIDLSNGTSTRDGTSISTINTFNNFSAFPNIYIGGNGYDLSKFVGNIYWFKIYKAGVLIRDFIPCQSTETNEYGLCDRIEDNFYLGTGMTGGSNTSERFCMNK